MLLFVYASNNDDENDDDGGGVDMQIEYPYLIVVVNFVLVINCLFCC